MDLALSPRARGKQFNKGQVQGGLRCLCSWGARMEKEGPLCTLRCISQPLQVSLDYSRAMETIEPSKSEAGWRSKTFLNE